jgi:hypothetical protein
MEADGKEGSAEEGAGTVQKKKPVHVSRQAKGNGDDEEQNDSYKVNEKWEENGIDNSNGSSEQKEIGVIIHDDGGGLYMDDQQTTCTIIVYRTCLQRNFDLKLSIV